MISYRIRTIPACLFRAASCAALVLVTTGARAQAPDPAHAPAVAPENPEVVGGAPSVYLVDDALLTGIPLTAAQVQRLMGLRALHAEELTELQPQVNAALRTMARAHARHDEPTRRVVFAMLQTNAALTRLWVVTAAQALLTEEQRPQFEANVRALFGGSVPVESPTREPPTRERSPQGPPTTGPSTTGPSTPERTAAAADRR